MKTINAEELKERVLKEIKPKFAEQVIAIIDSMPEAEKPKKSRKKEKADETGKKK